MTHTIADDLPELVTGTDGDRALARTTEPIISGFYPDPSICQVDGTYYLVSSSFEYLPAVPLHSSTDLVSWTPMGNVLTRSSQIAEHGGHASTGIYAPTIRHHDGRFWVIGTNVLDLVSGRGHFLVHAQDPGGPWSEPVHLNGTLGIDPDIAWDDDGVCHVTWASFDPRFPGIVSAPCDTSTGALLDEPRRLWQGSGLATPEGPHLYRVDGWWYLVLAEGGTERGHAATIARARTLDGPFEAAPNNPFLTHRSSSAPVQNVGHADLVELTDGSWAAVHLGVRLRGQTPGFHVNGRETFLVGIEWDHGWPTVDESRFAIEPADHSFIDTFDTARLDQRWVGVGRFPTSFTRRGRDGELFVDAPDEPGTSSLLATRARDMEWSAEICLGSAEGSGRFVVRLDDRHQYGLQFDGNVVEAFASIGPARQSLGTTRVVSIEQQRLRISAKAAPQRPYGGSDEPDLIELALVDHGGAPEILGTLDGRYLSTEVAGGFTGRIVGVEALTGSVSVSSFRYTTTPRNHA